MGQGQPAQSNSPEEREMWDRVIHGDALDVLRSMPDNSVDAIVTDPP
jgi:DNA modification methylase